MWYFLYLLKMKQASNTRHLKKIFIKIIKLVMIAVFLWIIMFNVYALFYKLDELFNSNRTRQYNKYGFNERKDEPFPFNNHNGHEHNSNIKQIDKNKNEKNYGKQNEFELAKIIDSNSLEFFKKIQRKDYDINCQALIEWDEEEHRKAKRILYKLKNSGDSDNDKKNEFKIPLLPDANFIFDESMCNLYRELRGYDQYKIHPFEYEFPLAFIILTYNNVEQFERLLKAVYRPQNVYCIHVDAKSSNVFHEAIKSIVRCFNNVFITTKLEKIVYASFSRLKADINCMSDLVKPNFSHPNMAGKNFTTDWKYLLNMASTEFPLRTNYELTRILHMFNGANDIETMINYQTDRVMFSWKVKRKENTSYEYLVKTKKLKTKIPHNYTIVKGITYCAFSKKFVEYTLTNPYAKNLLKWSQDTYSPDEWYWATLQYNVQFNPPGGFRELTRSMVPTKTRFIGWKHAYKCMGELRHNLCVFSFGDVPELVTRNEYFLNKFLLDFDPIAMQCIEEWLNNKVSIHQTVNVIYYCRLLFVKPYSINPTCARLAQQSANKPSTQTKTTTKRKN